MGRMRHILTGIFRGHGLRAAIAAVLLVGCVATVEERPPRVVYVGGPPPPPLVDPRPAPAAPGMVWVEGYWHWNGVQYVWIPGHWESPPAGYAWVGPSYTIVGGRHVYRAGEWRRSGLVAEPR
jgi:hypothetical protein